MTLSDSASKISGATKGVLILLCSACTMVMLIHDVYVIPISDLQTWRLVLITLTVSSLLFITFKREELSIEYKVLYFQLWMIY
ncbi:MAG: hypothetical protein RTU30_13440, partial [Candidatus Thorarchaeota archaeon]